MNVESRCPLYVFIKVYVRQFALFLYCGKNKCKGNRAAKSASTLLGTSAKRKIWTFGFATRFGNCCIGL